MRGRGRRRRPRQTRSRRKRPPISRLSQQGGEPREIERESPRTRPTGIASYAMRGIPMMVTVPLPGVESARKRMAGKQKLVAVFPAFNEAGHVGKVVESTRPFVDRVIVVDDGSQDDTAAEACSAGACVF